MTDAHGPDAHDGEPGLRTTAGPDAGQGPAHGPAGRRRAQGALPRRARAAASRHWPFLAALAGATALRAVVMLGYPPAMWFNDSYSYVYDAVHHILSPERPSGYPAFLDLLMPLHSFAVVAAAQHVMGLGAGVGTYALLRRRGLPGWGATLAAVPVLFGAFQVQLEQQVMSDTLFLALLMLAVVLLCWDDRIRARLAAAAGLAIGLAMIVRSVGLPLLVVVTVCLLARRVGWRPLAALLTAGVAPVAAYVVAFHAQNGSYAITNSDGIFLYGRVMSFADCAVIKPPASLRPLCDSRPPARRPIAAEYIWGASDPLQRFAPAPDDFFNVRVNGLARRFAVRAIVAQPASYLRVVAEGTARSFGWRHDLAYDRKTEVLYLFSDPPPQIRASAHWPSLRAYQPGLTEPRAVAPYAGFLRAYQSQVYLRGVLLGAILAIGLAGVAARWRRRGGVGLLPWAVAAMLLLVPVAVAGFSYRHELAAVPFACLAAGLAFSRRRSGRGQGEAMRLS